MKYIGIMLFCLASLGVKAQDLNSVNFNLFSGNQQIIHDATKDGLVIVSQSYQLEDTVTHQKFGRYGKPEFGQGYSVGVKISGKLILQRSAVEPWNEDPNFERYKKSHMPVRYKRTIRECGDTLITEKIVQNEHIDDLYRSELFALQDSSINVKQGFQLDTLPGHKSGWLIWVIADNPIEKSDSIHNEYLMIYKSELSFNNEQCEVNIKAPSTEKEVWGGIFVTPVQTSVGQITFFLSGIIQYKGNDIWSVISPFMKEAITPITETLDDLTPIETIKEDVIKENTDKPVTDSKKKKKTKKK